MNNISIILNGYKRPANLNEQYKSLIEQTIKPKQILLWYNQPQSGVVNEGIGKRIPTAYSTVNLGVWARFAYALNAKSQFICVFDDDTIPGKQWLQNCLTVMQENEGLLGTIGLLYTKPVDPNSNRSSYNQPYIRYGWANPNEEVKQVDFVGHCWFFKREWLSYFWRELPNPKYNICGEDMHFSYMLQKYAGIKTYVPPHPKGNIQMWGSIKGYTYGMDRHALSISNQSSQQGIPFNSLMNQYYIMQRKKGWKLINE